MKSRNLTGRFRFRPAAFGRVVLQCEYCWHGIGPGERPTPEAVSLDRFDWRDADMEDLLHPALRRLLPKEEVA